jgi:hypothetical protein
MKVREEFPFHLLKPLHILILRMIRVHHLRIKSGGGIIKVIKDPFGYIRKFLSQFPI